MSQQILKLEVLLENGKDPKLLDVELNNIDKSKLIGLSQEVRRQYDYKMNNAQVLKSTLFGKDKDSVNWVLKELDMLEKTQPQENYDSTALDRFNYSNIKTFTELNFYKSIGEEVYIPVIIAQELSTEYSCRIYYYKKSDMNNSKLTLYKFDLPDVSPSVYLVPIGNTNSFGNKTVLPSDLILLEDWLEFTSDLLSLENWLNTENIETDIAVSNTGTKKTIYYEVYGTDNTNDIIKDNIATQTEVYIQGIHFKDIGDINQVKFKQNQEIIARDNRFRLLARSSFTGQLNKDSYVPQLFHHQDKGFSLIQIKKFLDDRPKPPSSFFSRLGLRTGGNVTKKKKAVKKQFRKTARQK